VRRRVVIRGRTLLALFGCLLAAIPAARAQQISTGSVAAWEGKRIAVIRIVDDDGQVLPDKLPQIPLEVGVAFNFAAERESLRRLYHTGRYADIRTDAADITGGLRLDFVVELNYFNNVVRVEGLNEPPSEAAALAAMRINLGEPFRETVLKEGIARLEDALHNEGLYLASVDYTLEPQPDSRGMDIDVHVTPGERARIGAIALHNQTSFTDAKLLKVSRLKPRRTLTSERLDRSSTRLRKYLVRQGHFGADASLRAGAYDPQTNKVSLVYDVAAGPRVRIELTGARISQGKLRQLLPIYAEGAVDEDLLQEGRRNIRDSLQGEGYFDADVTFTSTEDSAKGERVITYNVNRGDQHKLAGVGFDGNRYFNSKLLAERLETQPASFANRGRYSQRMVSDDRDSIRDLYIANGFLQAQVAEDVKNNYSGKNGDIFVQFHVLEGQQTLVGALKIDGNHAFSGKEISAVMGSTPGEPYSEANIASDRNNVLALYFNDGYPEARFEEQQSPAAEPNRINLTYHITEGEQIRVARVLLIGFEHVRRGTVSRQVELKPHEPLRESDVAETQRHLYNLGVFNRVAIAPQNPAGSDPDKTMLVDVNEGSRYTFGYGFGFEAQRLSGTSANPADTYLNFSPRGLVEIGDNDFLGRAQSLSLKARASTQQYRGVLSYVVPDLVNDPNWSLQLTGFADKTQDVNTFTSIRLEASLQFDEKVSTSSTIVYRYFFRHVEVPADSLHVAPDEIPLFSQPTKVSGFGLTWVRDRRDNPVDASRGMFNTVDTELASESLGSSANFYRVFFQNSSFTPFGKSFVFARSVRFGIEEPYSGTGEDKIPLPERFFAGGATTIRGFGLNQAGPRDPVTGFPVGGLAEMVFNQELHFPTKLPFIGNRVGGTVFYDFGNVYSDWNHITWRSTPSSPTNLNYLSHTVGAGLRYGTPIGPVRVDFGYQIKPPQFQFTNATTMQPELERLTHFQFFFNIGPIF
jgi:outer membrane protein insertion porin family